MATQIVPQVQVFQEFNLIPAPVTAVLRAFIFGPHFNVRSYLKNKDEVYAGEYQGVAVTHSIPSVKPGETIKEDSVSVTFDQAKIRYASGISCSAVAPNILRLSSNGWRQYLTYGRHVNIPFDVSVGDEVSFIVSSTQYRAKVIGFDHELSNTSVGPVTVASTNTTTSTAGSAPVVSYSTAVGSGAGTIAFTTTNFRPYIKGLTTVQYTFTVIQSGGPGTAKVSVTSTNNVDNFTFIIDNTSSPITTSLGLQISFSGIPSGQNFTTGTTWIYNVTCAFTATPASAFTITGSYNGAYGSDTVQLYVIKGGDISSSTSYDPVIAVSTAKGTYYKVLTFPSATAVSLPGTDLNIAISNGTQLCANDVFSFNIIGREKTRVRDLKIDTSIPAGTTSVDLFVIRNNVNILKPYYDSPSLTNWTVDTNAKTISFTSNILAYIPKEPSLNGLPITFGKVYVNYKAFEPSTTDTVKTISDVSQLSDYFSDLSPENPLGFAVKKALENANGTEVKFIGVRSESLSSYIDVLEKVLEREDVYSFVPLTKDKNILNAVVGHVKQQSTPEKGRWRIAWVTFPTPDVIRITPDTDTYLATVSTSGTPPVVTLTSSTAKFVDWNVRSGDKVRINYSLDAAGDEAYEEYTVNEVISNTQLTLVYPGSVVDFPVAIKFEIWRNPSLDEQVEYLSSINSFASRRVYAVIGGNKNVADGYTNVDDMYLAAALAGLRSGVAPHQGLTNVAISGFEKITWTSHILKAHHRDTLMNGGFWVVEQNDAGDIYTRKQISTDLTDLNTTEQSVTTNVDSISYYMKRTLAPYIGRTNNVDTVYTMIQADLAAAIQFFINNKTNTLGSQVLPGTSITEIRPHAVLKDRLVIRMNLVIPYPLNNIDLYLVI